jgi:transcriptional regulator with XRE-family HTH domain
VYLPGTVGERIGDLRSGKGWSQRKLAEMIDVAPSQLSRLEKGETQTVSSDILIKLAKAFGVSADYILGLTAISKPKSRDISELGLSEGAVTALLAGKIDVQILNRLVEHGSFPYLLYMIKNYLDDSVYARVMTRNAMIDMATAAIGDFAKDNTEHKKEALDDTRYLRSEKLSDHEAELEKIKSIFMAMLKDIKKNIGAGETPEVPATAEFLQTMREQIQAARTEQRPIGAEDITAAVLGMVGQTAALDGESMELFRQLTERLLFLKKSEKNTDPERRYLFRQGLVSNGLSGRFLTAI